MTMLYVSGSFEDPTRVIAEEDSDGFAELRQAMVEKLAISASLVQKPTQQEFVQRLNVMSRVMCVEFYARWAIVCERERLLASQKKAARRFKRSRLKYRRAP